MTLRVPTNLFNEAFFLLTCLEKTPHDDILLDALRQEMLPATARQAAKG